MTEPQFDVLTSMLRMRSGPILTACKLVLVHGERQIDASRETGCATGHLARAIGKLNDADKKVRSAYCTTV